MPNFRLKHQIKRFFAFLLITCLLLPLASKQGIAYGQDAKKDYVTVCIERRTLGQGYFIEPTRVELQEGDTAATVLIRLLEEKGYEYQCTGSAEGGDFYLSAIQGADNGTLDIPAYITGNGGPSNDVNNGNSDDYLGELDYSPMSGWMITVNNVMIDRSSAQWPVADGDCIRWAFTLWGYGADLGYSTGWGEEAYYSEPDRGELLKEIATVRAASGDFLISQATVYNKAYDTALSFEATRENVENATAELKSAYENYEKKQSTPKKTEVKALPYSIEEAVDKASDYLLAKVTDPICGSTGGEWAVLELARAGKITEEFKKTYLTNLTNYVKEKNGVLHSKKLTEYSRVTLALTAIGEDPTNFAGYNLLKPLADYDKTVWQGINGAIYALIAFDTGNYEIPTLEESGTQTTRENLIQFILDKELTDGGWTLRGTNPDPDITMMAIQGLAKYTEDNTLVKEAVERGLAAISAQQREDGGLASWGTINSESVAQSICALCALGIDPASDSRFIKEDGSWLLSSLFSFMVEEKNNQISFAHVGCDSDLMATEQASYALVAYNRLLQNKNGLYDMSDVQKKQSEMGSKEATLVVPKNVPNRKGTQFAVTLRLGSLADETTLIDGILSYSPNLDVVNVKVEDTVLGGTLNWNASAGTLRFVYMDILNGSELTSTQEGMQDFIQVVFSIREPLQGSSNLGFSLNSLRQMKDTETITEYHDPVVNHETSVESIDVAATVLYQGDGTDWIPVNKKAVKVVITGLDSQNEGIGFQCDNNSYSKLYKSSDFTSYSGLITYIMLVNSEVTKDQLEDSANYYTYPSEQMETIAFADTNKDNVIDAQDALNIVSLWLRKSEPEVTSELILTYNVTGDAKIDSVDALAVVEYFIKKKPFAIRLK